MLFGSGGPGRLERDRAGGLCLLPVSRDFMRYGLVYPDHYQKELSDRLRIPELFNKTIYNNNHAHHEKYTPE